MKQACAATKGASLAFPAVLVLALLSAVAPLATDMYLPGFPLMAGELQTSAASVQMTLTSFLLGLALGQLLVGPLSDRFGRLQPLLLGTALAIISGALCAITSDIGTLIVLRALQGLGGGAGIVLARAIISDRTSDANESAKLFQLIMVIGGLAPILAPIAGTCIVELAGWRAVFATIAVLSALALAGTICFLPESLPHEKRSQGGVAALGRAATDLMRNRAYLAHSLSVGFAFMVIFAYIAASPFVFQEILGLSSLEYSIAFGVNALGIAIVSLGSARLVGRISPQRQTLAGLLLMLCGAAATLACVLANAGATLLLPAIFITVIALGLILGNASALALDQARDNAGTASAIIGALQFCLGAIASPIVGLAGGHSAMPMAILMLVAAVLALYCHTIARSSNHQATHA